MNRILTKKEFSEFVSKTWKESERKVAEFDACMKRCGYVQVEYLTYNLDEKPRFRFVELPK